MERLKKIDLLITCIFLKLGLNLSNAGVRYLKELIKMAYISNELDIKYKELCNKLSKKLNVSIKKVDSNIYTAVNTINVGLAKKNFPSIFHTEFDYYYISPKKLLVLFLNILEREKI